MHTTQTTHTQRASLLFIALILNLFSVNGPRPAAQTKPAHAQPRLSFAVIGDSGTGKKEQYAVAQAMEREYEKEPFDLVLMLGDNIYGGGGGKGMVEKFEAPYRDLLARGVKFQAALGNHDNGKADDETGYAPFNMSGRRYYSFRRNGDLAQFFALDSARMDPQQLAWLEKELAASTSRWKIAFFHHPLYSSGRAHGSDLKLRRALEPLLVRYGVQLVLSGHDHFYERIKPQRGVAYFVSGAAGKLRRGDINRQDPLLEAGNDETYHFMRFDLGADEIRFHAIDLGGEAIDTGIIRRNARMETRGN